MGHYTSIRFCAQLNEAGRQILVNLLGTHMNERPWEGVAEDARADAMSYSEELTAYAQLGRSSFIPFGALADDEWADIYRAIGNAPDELKRVLHGQTSWNVCCSLKNYDAEVLRFCALLAHMIRHECEVIINIEGVGTRWTWIQPVLGNGACLDLAKARAMLEEELANEIDPFG